MNSVRRHLSYANIVATLALALAVGGTSAYASGLVTSKHIKNGTIRSVDIRNGGIKTADLASSARVEAYSNSNNTNVTLSSTPTVDSVAIPAPGDYVLTAKTILNNNQTTAGVQVTCTLYAEGVPIDAAVTTLEVKAVLGGPNASTDTVSAMGTHTFAASGTAALQCDSGGSNVTAADAVITAIRVP
jgi:hypothetical protein